MSQSSSLADSSDDKGSYSHVGKETYESVLGIGPVFVRGYSDSTMLSSGSPIRTEIVGSIKAKPEDFVVQEIMNFKDLSLLTQADDAKHETVKVACFDERPLEPSTTLGHNEQTEETKAKEESADTGAVDIDWKAAADSPKVILERIMQTSPTLRLAEPIDQLVKDLSALQTRTLEQLISSSSSSDVNNTVTITLKGENNRIERGRIHQWVRSAYCLLQTEVVQRTTTPKETVPNVMVIQVSPDDRFFELASYLYNPRQDIPRLYEFFRRGNQEAQEDIVCSRGQRGDWRATQLRLLLPLRLDLERSERRPVHQVLAAKSARQLDTETVKDFELDDSASTTSAIAVTWSGGRKRKRPEKSSRTTHTLLVLRKRNVEHWAAIHSLTKALRCRVSDIQVAGIKDRVAVTTQFLSLSRFVTVPRIIQAQAKLRGRGLDLCGPMMVLKDGLRRGQNLGNRFRITIRDMYHITDAARVPCGRASMEEAVGRVGQYGFINFYGEQRIGALHVDGGARTKDVGRAILQEDWSKVFDLLMRNGTDANSMRVSQVWQASGGNLEETWKALAKRQGNDSRQRMLLQSLRRHGAHDPLVALKSLSFSDRAFWVSSYQSYVWNLAATARIREYGSDEVVVGDLVSIQSTHSEATECAIHVTSEEMAQQYSIKNVVLPLPGYLVQYPSNKVGQVYHDILTNDGIECKKDAPLDATAKGAYRPLIAYADNLAYEWMPGEDGVAPACDLTFDLPSGSYATMVLRELFRTTTTKKNKESQGRFLTE